MRQDNDKQMELIVEEGRTMTRLDMWGVARWGRVIRPENKRERLFFHGGSGSGMGKFIVYTTGCKPPKWN